MSGLEGIIEASPIELLPSEFYMLRNVDASDGIHFFVADDGQEKTTLTRDITFALRVPAESRRGPFRLLRLHVAIPFDAPGFLAAATAAIAGRGVSVLILSTFTFDYVLIKAPETAEAVQGLLAAGFPLHSHSENDF